MLDLYTNLKKNVDENQKCKYASKTQNRNFKQTAGMNIFGY